MDLNLSEDQLALQEAFANFFSKASTPEVVRAAEPLGFDADAVGAAGADWRTHDGRARGRWAAGAPASWTWWWWPRSSASGWPRCRWSRAWWRPTCWLAAGAPADVLAGLVDGTVLATVALAPLAGGLARAGAGRGGGRGGRGPRRRRAGVPAARRRWRPTRTRLAGQPGRRARSPTGASTTPASTAHRAGVGRRGRGRCTTERAPSGGCSWPPPSTASGARPSTSASTT